MLSWLAGARHLGTHCTVSRATCDTRGVFAVVIAGDKVIALCGV